jgi:hypothetical protein
MRARIVEALPWFAALPADIAAAASASFVVAPFIAMVDQAIIQNASGTMSLVESLAGSLRLLATAPHRFVSRPAFLMLWGVYGGTYITANTITSYSDRAEATNRQRNAAKFVGVTATNLTLNVGKDMMFARMFGSGPPRPVPWGSLGLFGGRDSISVFASFNLAPLAASTLTQHEICSSEVATAVCQIGCPIAVQWLSAPLHLLGLDWYNRPEGRDRCAQISKNYVSTAIARSARIGPAFGVGALLNNPWRESFHGLASDCLCSRV